jgi:preprotein translocase subunit SecG
MRATIARAYAYSLVRVVRSSARSARLRISTGFVFLKRHTFVIATLFRGTNLILIYHRNRNKVAHTKMLYSPRYKSKVAQLDVRNGTV